jgi:hypothetical protein
MNAWRSPPRIGQAHLANQIDDFLLHARPTLWMAALPSPIQAESSSVPSDDGFGLENEQCRPPVVPQLGDPNPEDTISPAEIKLTATGSTLQDQQLMAEGEDLGLERSPTSNAFPNRRKQQENDRGHDTLNLPRQSSKFNWLNKNGVFGMDEGQVCTMDWEADEQGPKSRFGPVREVKRAL